MTSTLKELTEPQNMQQSYFYTLPTQVGGSYTARVRQRVLRKGGGRFGSTIRKGRGPELADDFAPCTGIKCRHAARSVTVGASSQALRSHIRRQDREKGLIKQTKRKSSCIRAGKVLRFFSAKFFTNLSANWLQNENATHFLHCKYLFESVGLQGLTLFEHWNGGSVLHAA